MADIKNQPEKKIGAAPEEVKPVLSEGEQAVSPESGLEAEVVQEPRGEEVPVAAGAEEEKPGITTVTTPLAAPTPKSQSLVKIEKILEEDLEDFYFSMPPEQQKVFKEKGEETASAVEKMIRAGRVVAGKILKLIRTWLKLIPGVNKFFLEQEAKIKTDKIVNMAEKDRKSNLEG
jgi:hypothetical protein